MDVFYLCIGFNLFKLKSIFLKMQIGLGGLIKMLNNHHAINGMHFMNAFYECI